MEMKSFLRANLDRVIAVVLVVVGVLALLIGWVGVSGSGLAAAQLPYLISGGLGGIGMIAVGCTVWVSADIQDEWRRLDSLEERMVELRKATLAAASSTTETVVVDAPAAEEAPAPAPRTRRRATPKAKEASA
jgi:hypothetical protein